MKLSEWLSLDEEVIPFYLSDSDSAERLVRRKWPTACASRIRTPAKLRPASNISSSRRTLEHTRWRSNAGTSPANGASPVSHCAVLGTV